jgi:hypothetical protein
VTSVSAYIAYMATCTAELTKLKGHAHVQLSREFSESVRTGIFTGIPSWPDDYVLD